MTILPSVDSVLATLSLVGSNLPAYKALLDEVLTLFSQEDRDTLRAAYERAKADSDAQHAAAQAGGSL